MVARRLVSYDKDRRWVFRNSREHLPGFVPAISGALLGAGPSSAVKYEPGLKEQSLGYRCVMVTRALFWLKLKIFLSFHNIYLQRYVDAALGAELLLQTSITDLFKLF